MSKYDDERLCPKCGYGGVTTEYVRGQWPEKSGTEYLGRRCDRCSYYWQEAPLDAEPR